MPRPRKLNAIAIKRVAEAVRAGNTREVAAAAAGVCVATLWAWRREGNRLEALADAGEPFDIPKRDALLYIKLVEALRDADLGVEREIVDVVVAKAREGHVGAATWWLEKRRPESWGKRVVVAGDEAAPLKVDATVDTGPPRPVDPRAWLIAFKAQLADLVEDTEDPEGEEDDTL